MGDRILLLGGSGFIGRHVRTALEDAGHPVVAVASTAGPFVERRFDLTDDPQGLIAEVDPVAVVNCAGLTSGTVTQLVTANTLLVARLIDALAGRRIRLVQLGSSAEYGAGDEGRRTLETDSAEPVSPYGATKLAATRLIGIADELDAVVLRVFNPVGRGSSPSSLPGLAARLIQEAIAGGRAAIHLADLGSHRDFIDVRDVADAVERAVVADRLPRIVNIGTGKATTARELVGMIAEAAGYPGSVEEDAAGSPRSAGVRYQVADVSLARASLGWIAKRSLRDAAAALWTETAARPIRSGG